MAKTGAFTSVGVELLAQFRLTDVRQLAGAAAEAYVPGMTSGD